MDNNLFLTNVSDVIDLNKVVTIIENIEYKLSWKKLNDNGRQSIGNIFNYTFMEFNLLHEMIRNYIYSFCKINIHQSKLVGFININDIIDIENEYHDHPESSPDGVSGVLYLKCSDTSYGGELEFINPDLTLSPRNGDLYIFPWDYKHRVTKYSSTQRRINIAFNLIMK